jgi:hypothetical protein
VVWIVENDVALECFSQQGREVFGLPRRRCALNWQIAFGSAAMIFKTCGPW